MIAIEGKTTFGEPITVELPYWATRSKEILEVARHNKDFRERIKMAAAASERRKLLHEARVRCGRHQELTRTG